MAFVERPALLLQDPGNRASARACANCHVHLPRPSDADATSDETTTCAWGCGEPYCDAACRDAHFARGGHRVVCVGPLDAWEHPIAALKLEAARDEHGDGILPMLVAAFARCVAVETLSARDDDDDDDDGGGGGPLASANLRWFARGPWWDLATAVGDSARGETLRARCEAYASLLSAAAAAVGADEARAPTPRGAGEETSPRLLPSRRLSAADAWNADAVAELAGLVARNQLSVVVPSPSGREEEAYDGAGVFPLTCLMNHDCEPNAEVRFETRGFVGAGNGGGGGGGGDGDARGVVAVTVATRDVRAGEELRHAYVETDAAAPMRAAQLARFGFRCDCARCAREMGGARRRETLGE